MWLNLNEIELNLIYLKKHFIISWLEELVDSEKGAQRKYFPNLSQTLWIISESITSRRADNLEQTIEVGQTHLAAVLMLCIYWILFEGLHC